MRKEAAYLLKMWNDGESDRTWRASLQEVHSKKLVSFSSVEHLLDYLAQHKLVIHQELTSGKALDRIILD